MKCFMRYVDACLVSDLQEMTYRIYVTDTLKSISGANVRYADIGLFNGNETV